jgi:type IV pilus assembly protein PilA
MLHKLRQRAQDEKGFTLIELLVVILIIGILAAIALPAFLNQRTKAQDTEAKSKARTAQTALETLYVNEQSYATATDQAALAGIEPSLSQGPAMTVPTHTAAAWKVTVTSASTSTFSIEKTVDAAGVPTVSRTCAPIDKGGCPHAGTW